MSAVPNVVHHFSEDPALTRFVAHVPPTNPTQAAAVWAIDDSHAPLYWFPRAVEPIAIEPVGDLLDLHAAGGIELRVVPSLWPIHDLAVNDSWDFSIVRMRNALPRS